MTVTVDPDGGTVVDVIVDAPAVVDVILPPPITLIDLGNIGGPTGPPGPQGEPGPPGPQGPGVDLAESDARYVNTTGDEMSGTLFTRSGPTPNVPQIEVVGDYPFLRFHQPNVTFAGIALRPGAGLQMTTGHDMNALAPLRVGSPQNGDDAARVDWVQSSIAGYMAALPRGVVAYAQITDPQTDIITVVDIVGLSATWTADPTRMYQTTVHTELYSSVGGDTPLLRIADTTDAMKARTATPLITGGAVKYILGVVEAGLSGPQTRKVILQRATGTGALTAYASPEGPAFILVEDIGPTPSAALLPA